MHKIEVNEYECLLCGYKWINRINGVNKPLPRRCSKCKSRNWNRGGAARITRVEDGLRRRIKGLNQLYQYDMERYEYVKNTLLWPKDLVEQFLGMDPRPTIIELQEVIGASPLGRFNMTLANNRRGWIPNPERPGFLMRDFSHYTPDPDRPGRMMYNRDPTIISEYEKWIVKEAKLREKLIREIIKSRKSN